MRGDGLEAAKDAVVVVGACVVHRVVGGDNSLFLNKGSCKAGVSSVERARLSCAFHVRGRSEKKAAKFDFLNVSLK